MIPITPRGFKDVLPEEARWRESITKKVQERLASWGYDPIETPTLEVLKVLELGGQLDKTTFRLFDSDGALLVLRPDVTLPVARLVASKLKTIDDPLRFRYVQPVFREDESLHGQAREFTQIGVELIGESSAAADAEVILLLIDALKSCGLKEFTIAMCTVGVLKDLLSIIVKKERATQTWRTSVLKAYHQNNLVEVGALADSAGIDPRYGNVLRELIHIRGTGEAIERCRKLVEPLGCTDGLDMLAETYKIIENVGAAGFVTIDFSVMSTFDYYTGLVFEAYAPRLGRLLGSGGRYDRMLEVYGKSAPAAGFAFTLESIMAALFEQGILVDKDAARPERRLVFLNANDPSGAFIKASELRAAGESVLLMRSTEGETL